MIDYEDHEYGDNPNEDKVVDFDYLVKASELPELFDETSVDDFIANLNDWD